MVENKYEILEFGDNDFELEINVSPKEETVRLSLEEITILFERDRSVIGKHIRKFINKKNYTKIEIGQKMPDI